MDQLQQRVTQKRQNEVRTDQKQIFTKTLTY